MNPSRAIWWVKRDMRLADNEALTTAVEHHEHVIALFICEPSIYNAADTSPMHVFAWWQGLSALQVALRDIGGELYFGVGEAQSVLEHLYSKHRFDAVYSHEETGNALTYARDKRVRYWCDSTSVKWVEKTQNGVVRGNSDREARSQIIHARLFEESPVPAPQKISSWSVDNDSTVNTQWPDYSTICNQKVDVNIQFPKMQRLSEHIAGAELQHFLQQRVNHYSRGISSPNTAFQTGSRLSAHLAWGTISAREIFYQSNLHAQEYKKSNSKESAFWLKNIRAFQSRLHWRDHFTQRLESASYMEHRALNSAFEKMSYENNPKNLLAWKVGKTGIPLVDACMRCLLATGFLNFRMRAMLVTTGCFGLRLSWEQLQYPLARVFYDYEPGIHFSQIQMQAGIVGINTMRVYNPHKQLLDQDPECRFIKRWIPELREFSHREICDYNNQCLGDYPSPVDNIAVNSADIKDQITGIKKSDEATEPTASVLRKYGSKRNSREKSTTRHSSSSQLKLPF